jgi:hypothetical protein
MSCFGVNIIFGTARRPVKGALREQTLAVSLSCRCTARFFLDHYGDLLLPYPLLCSFVESPFSSSGGCLTTVVAQSVCFSLSLFRERLIQTATVFGLKCCCYWGEHHFSPWLRLYIHSFLLAITRYILIIPHVGQE